MRRQARRQNTIKPIIWLVLICIPLWGLGLQTRNVSAYQSDESTSSPTLEPTATLSPEETQPTFTNTTEATLTAEPTATQTAASHPSFTPSVVPANSVTPLFTFTPSVVPANSVTPPPTDSPPLPILPGQYAPDEVLIRFKGVATDEGIQQCLASASAIVLSSIEELRVWVVQVPFGEVAESIAAISTCPEVRYVEPNYMAFIADTIPSDPGWSLQYGLVNIRAPQGWDYSTGSTAVTIAIVDSGVDLSHVDLAAKIIPGYDFVNNDSIAQDDNGHGTHVAGIAAASGNNGIGVAGVSWGARIMPVKVLNASGNGSFADVAAGIIWAADNGAQIINLSLGGASNSVVLQGAVDYASNRGVILVAAAGNTGANFVLYPAHYSNVIAVAATDNTNTHASFSNYGPEIDLSAPGASIYSTSPGGTYAYNSGTSMAAPYVSGLAAILLGIPGNGGSGAITMQMQSTALDLGLAGWDDFYGDGLIQMDRAIQSVLGMPTRTATLTQAPTLTPSLTPTLTPVVTVTPSASLTPTLTPGPTSTATRGRSGNPFLGFTNRFFSTLTPSPTPSQTPYLITTNTITSTGTSEVPLEQETGTSELNVLSTPQAQERLPFSTFAQPCLGVVLILLGIRLFVIAGRRPGHRRMNVKYFRNL